MTVSDYILRALRAAGIDVVFGLPGVHALGIWRALENSGMRYIGFRHEQSAAHAADGYGRATGKPGVVLLSTGPGALNSLSALGEAYVSSSPVVAITSHIPSRYVGKGKGYLHESKDLGPAFDAVTRYTARATSAGEIPSMIQSALATAIGGRPGPTLLEIPADILDAELDAPIEPVTRNLPEPAKQQIDEAAQLLRLAARPVIWAGGGCLRSGASASLVRVAELLGAPVVTTFMGKGAIPEDHPLAVGSLVRQPEVIELLRDADALLAVGTRFSAMDTGNWKIELPMQMIHIDIDPEEPGRNYPIRLGIVSDARKGLEALADSLGPQGPSEDRTPLVASIKKATTERAISEGPREMEMLQAVRAAVPAETVTVHDMTIASYWSAPFLPITVPGTFHYPYGYGSLGFSFPAAIGVAAATGKPVVSFSGDGGFQYHARELATIAQYDLPVIALVFNDRSWGILRTFSRARYDSEFALDLPGPDFMKLGDAYGVATHSAATPAELGDALRKAISDARPALIEVPGAWAPPPPADYYR